MHLGRPDEPVCWTLCGLISSVATMGNAMKTANRTVWVPGRQMKFPVPISRPVRAE